MISYVLCQGLMFNQSRDNIVRSCMYLCPSFPLCFVQAQEQFELLSYSEFGVHVDGVLYGCDLSHQLPSSPVSSSLSVDHVRSTSGDGPRARRAQRRVESARRRWRQPHSMRYLQDLLSYCVETDESEVEHAVTSKDQETARNSDSNDEDEDCIGSSRSRNLDTPSPNTLLQPNLPARPPRSPSPASGCLTPADNASSRISEEDAAMRANGFWLPSEAEKCLPHCGCGADNNADLATASGSMAGHWEGAAALHHGSTIRFGCVHFVLSVAGKPGHDQLVKSLLTLIPSAQNPHVSVSSTSSTDSSDSPAQPPGPMSSSSSSSLHPANGPAAC